VDLLVLRELRLAVEAGAELEEGDGNVVRYEGIVADGEEGAEGRD
jgi:hypothetical protein